jgi:hypothetical protein
MAPLYFSLPEVPRSESPQFVVTLDGLDPSMFHAHSETKQDTSSAFTNIANTDSESSAVEYEDEKQVIRTEEVQREKRAASPILYQKSSGSDATGILCFEICDLGCWPFIQEVKQHPELGKLDHLFPTEVEDTS